MIMIGYSAGSRSARRGRVWTPALASAMVSDRTRAALVSGMRGRGSAGRASPCQGEGRGFESRRPLGASLAQSRWGAVFPGGVAERRGNGLQIRVHGFKSRLHLGDWPGQRHFPTASLIGRMHRLLTICYSRAPDRLAEGIDRARVIIWDAIGADVERHARVLVAEAFRNDVHRHAVAEQDRP